MAIVMTGPREVAHSGRVEALRCAVLRRHLLLQGTAQVADAATTITIATLLVLETASWRSPTELATALIFALLPAALCLPIAWHVADAPDRSSTLARTHLVRAAICLSGLMVLLSSDRMVGFVIIGLMTGAQSVSSSVRAAALPFIVPNSRLLAANSLCTLSAKVAGTLGVAAAIVLGHVHPSTVFVAAALLHVVATIGYATWNIDLGGRCITGATAPNLRRAWRQLMSDEFAARSAFAAVGGRGLLGAAVMMLAISADRHYGMGSAGYAAAIGICAAGALCGSAIGPSWSRRAAGRKWARRTGQIALVAALVASLTPTMGTSAAVVFIFAVMFGALRNRADTTVMSAIDDVDRGRFFAIYDASYQVTYLLGAVSAALSPLAGDRLGLGVVAGLTVAATAAIATRNPSRHAPSQPPRTAHQC